MNILETIIASKKTEIAERRSSLPAVKLESMPEFDRDIISLKQSLLQKTGTGIIAEFKRRSPSKGVINDQVNPVDITSAYTKHGAAGLSILTDSFFFGGSTADLVAGRVNNIPILRKDFIIDEYQIVEAKSMGADVILLIAACLLPLQVKRLAAFARSTGLEVLLEIHEEAELEHICENTEIIGVNNRDLKTFQVDIERSLRMAEQIPADKIKVAESGITSVDTIILFRENGFSGFLIGENFMKEPDPAIAFAGFVQQLKQKLHES